MSDDTRRRKATAGEEPAGVGRRYPWAYFLEVFPLDRDVRIIFVLIEGDILIKVDYGGGRSVGEFLGFDSDDEELKAIAEDHRLDLVCRILGIRD